MPLHATSRPDYAANHTGNKVLPHGLYVVGAMKEYRLSAWPDLDPSYERTAYRRMLSDMSQRHVTLAQLYARSGLPRQQVTAFVAMLVARGLVIQREAARGTRFAMSLRPLGGWLRRAIKLAHGNAP